ncbi:MAG: PKD domain-containing protein [Solirubrobacterales bacterium]
MIFPATCLVLLLCAGSASAAGVEVSGPSADRYFSPNGDGQDDVGSVGYGLSVPAHVGIVIRTGGGARVRLVEAGASHSAGGQYFSWDGRDDGGAAVPDGVYTYTITAEGQGGETDTASGKIGIDTRIPVQLTQPLPNASLSSPTTVKLVPASGISLQSAYAYGYCPYVTCGQSSSTVQPDGSLLIELDLTQWYSGANTLNANVYYEDQFGQGHGYPLPQVPITVQREAKLTGLSEDRYFSPNEDGQDDIANVGFSLSAEAKTTVKILDSDGDPVRTVESQQQRQQGGQYFSWDGRDDGGAAVPDGVYTYTITAEGQGGETDTASGKIGIDTKPAGAVTAPSAGDTLASIAQLNFQPRPGLQMEEVSFCIANGCAPVFEPSVDGSWRTSRDTLNLPDGVTAVTAQAWFKDPFGAAHYRSWSVPVTIDNTTPAVDLAASPLSGEAPLKVAATISAYQARGVELDYQLDFGDGSPPATGKISPPYDPIEISHTFTIVGLQRLRATVSDGKGHSAERSVDVRVRSSGDETPPSVSFQKGPVGPIPRDSASFAFKSNEAGSSFRCALDGAAFQECDSPVSYAGLAQGDHIFAVKAIDAAGNPSLPVSRKFTVDTVAPQTLLDSAPSGHTGDHTPSFSFSADEPASFRCVLDGGQPIPCASPRAYPPLAEGEHTFSVYAVDSAGNVDATAATSAFVIDPPPAPNAPPVASLELDSSAGTAPLSVHAAIGAEDADGDPLAYELSFGDGSATASGDLPAAPLAHAYAHPGSFQVRLSVSDGQATVERTATVVATLPEPLRADAGDDRQVTVGETVELDGGGSRPGPLIDGYEWDLGDGQTGNGAHLSHSYAAPGVYTAKLTARSGDQVDSDTAAITVVPPAAFAGLTVHVTGGGTPLGSATVAYVAPDGSRISSATDGSGAAKLANLPDGTSTLYVSAPGFRPQAFSATLEHGQGEASVDLEPGEIGASTLESKRLTLEEILEKGIDVADPENSHVYEAKIHLYFEPDEPPTEHVIDVYVTPEGVECISNCGGGGGGGGGGSGGGGGGITAGGYQYLPSVTYVPGGEPVIQWLVLPIRASFLKEFFEVKMVIQNLTGGIAFSPGVAALQLPGGLSLAPTAVRQNLSQPMAAIPGGQSRTVSWVVRGDVEGEYDLSADYSAYAEAIAQSVYLQARTRSPLKVWAASALRTKILVDEKATRWAPYGVDVAITNVADVPVYNMQVEMLDREANAPADEALFFYAPAPPQVQGTAEIKPGETWTAHYVLFPGLGNEEVTRLRVVLEKSFVERTGGDVDLKPELGIRAGPSLGPSAGPIKYELRHGSKEDEALLSWQRPSAPAGRSVKEYELWTRQALDRGAWSPYRRVPSAGNGQESVAIPAKERARGRYYAVGTVYSDGSVAFVHQIGIGPPRYVSLGDSFSAGEGVPEFSPGTAADVSPVPDALKDRYPYDNTCHRSDHGSYGQRLVTDESLAVNVQPAEFAACSGAVTRDFETDNPGNLGESRQLDHLSQFTDVVTLTLGGNDIGFKDIAILCAAFDCDEILGAYGAIGSDKYWNAAATMWHEGSFIYSRIKTAMGIKNACKSPSLPGAIFCIYQLHKSIKALEEIRDHDPQRVSTPRNLFSGELRSRLRRVYGEIAEKAPNAHVLVPLYPQLTGGAKAADKHCHLYGNLPATLSADERDAISSFVSRLDDEIREAVREANRDRRQGGHPEPFEVVEPKYFAGHELCRDGDINPASDFNSVVIPIITSDSPVALSYSFHPNANGQIAYERSVAETLAGDLGKVATVMPRESSNAGSVFVPFGGRALHASSAWPGSTVTMSLVSPGGTVYDASSPGVRSGSTATSEWLEVSDPEPGSWQVRLFGDDVAAAGEPTQVSGYADLIQPQTPEVEVSATPVAGAADTFDLDADGPAGASYSWTFSDGTSADGASLRHHFGAGGRLWATAHVIAADGGEGWFPVELGSPAVDEVAPELAGAPEDESVDAGGAGGATVTYEPPAALDDVDGEVGVSCLPPSGSFFPVGSTTVTCSAEDASGNRTTVSFQVVVHGGAPLDATPPETRIDSGPDAGTDDPDASFIFSASEPGSSFECRLDGSGFGPCLSPRLYAGLAVGAHAFAVRATDDAGNVDPTPAPWSWSVEAASEQPTGPATSPASTPAVSPPAGSPSPAVANAPRKACARKHGKARPKTTAKCTKGKHKKKHKRR